MIERLKWYFDFSPPDLIFSCQNDRAEAGKAQTIPFPYFPTKTRYTEKRNSVISSTYERTLLCWQHWGLYVSHKVELAKIPLTLLS